MAEPTSAGEAIGVSAPVGSGAPTTHLTAGGVAPAPDSLPRGAGVPGRRIPLWVHAAILLLSLAVAVVVAWANAPGIAFVPGTDLGGAPAPGFRLTDYRGAAVALEDFRGKPVVLAFVYSKCPDACRLTGAGLRQTAQLLGQDARAVQFLGVSVDPTGDDPASVEAYLSRYNLVDRMRYLTGPAEALPAVWQSYYLFVNVEAGKPKVQGLEGHTDAVYVLDKQGRQRALLSSDFDPDELAAGLRALLAESW